jgi:hypothetical protein
MSEQLALSICAASVGFVAAVLFCIGNAFNASEEILLQATPFWDFNKHLAYSLTAQRAQYVVGALLLFFAFILQLAAALASGEKPAPLPAVLKVWWALLVAVLVPISLLSWLSVRLLFQNTFAKVLALEAARSAADECVETKAKVGE